MSRPAKALAAIVFCLSCILPALCGASFDYIVNRYQTDVEVGLDGAYQVLETLDFDFSTSRHGFFRDIPVGYGVRRAKVSDIRVSAPVQISRDRNYVSLQIGDPDVTVRGAQSYTVGYLYDPGDDGHYDYDEFYFNLVGEGWEVPIQDFRFRIVFPKPIDTDYIALTRGVWGSTVAEGVRYAVSVDRTVITGTAVSLMPGVALTIRVQLSEGYFQGMRQIRDWTTLACTIFLIGSVLAVSLAFFIWLRWGRDAEPIIMARYEAPDGLTPMDVGYLSDGVVDDKDITAMIFYWADKGNLTISESGRKKDYIFTRLQEPVDGSQHEQKLFRQFFSCGKDGVVTMPELEEKFGQYVEGVKHSVASYYTGDKSLSDSKSVGMAVGCGALAVLPVVGYAVAMTVNYMDAVTLLFLAGGIVAMFVGWLCSWSLMRKWYLRSPGANIALICVYCLLLVVEYFLLVGITLVLSMDVGGFWVFVCAFAQVVSISIIMFLSYITRKRSAYGQEMLEQVLGLREFIDKVEMDRLRMMIDHDPMVFYHVLSYAIVLGLENTWAKKFSSITIEPPNWYTGGDLVWDAMFYSALARRWGNSFRTARATMSGHGTNPRNPGMRFGGSSFGSSGFSGGGFGGGGGRAW
jgi:hypothetical protein